MFQHSWNADRLAFFVDHRISRGCAIERLYPAIFSNVEGKGICSSHRFGVEVYIVSDQEFARPNYSRARFRIKLVRPEIRLPVHLFYFVDKTFIVALPDDGEVCTFRIFRCFLVEIDRYLHFIVVGFSELICAFDRFLLVDVAFLINWVYFCIYNMWDSLMLIYSMYLYLSICS